MSSISVTEQALNKINAVRAERSNPSLHLRVTVEGGGCSGFQYIFAWDDKTSAEDQVFSEAVVTDTVSMPFLDNATLDYVVSMMGEDFKITNPNAKSGCGCGTSFSV